MKFQTHLVDINRTVDRLSVAGMTNDSKVSIRRSCTPKDTGLRVYVDSQLVGRLNREVNEYVYQHIIEGKKFICSIVMSKYQSEPLIKVEIELLGLVNSNNKQGRNQVAKHNERKVRVSPEKWFQELTHIVNEFEFKVGIYRIFNTQSGKSYIGQSRNLRARVLAHLRNLRDAKHPNSSLQHDWNARPNSILVEILDFDVLPAYLDRLELKYIERFNAYLEGYNRTFDGQSRAALIDKGEPLLEFTYTNRREIDIS